MKVCILGTGVMGRGIISLFAQSDKIASILWWGRDAESLENNYIKIQKDLARYARKNKLSTLDADSLLAKINLCSEFNELAGADIYVEAIVENLDAKKSLIASLSNVVSSQAIIATNTSSLSITALSMSSPFPTNFIGLHFFNPTSVMKLVEVVKGLTTSEETLTTMVALVEHLDKKPVVVQESPGFIVNRMLIPMINEAVAILAEGVASKEDIDNAMKFGANHPIGPIALADLIGNDVCLSIMETLHSETGDPKYRAHSLLRQYVRAGYLGRKVGVGFYEY